MKPLDHLRLRHIILFSVFIGLLPLAANAQMTVNSNQLALFEIYGVDEDEWIVPLTEPTTQPKELFGTARLDLQRSSNATTDFRLSMLNVERRLELNKSFTFAYGFALTHATGSRTVQQSGNLTQTMSSNANGAGVYVGVRLDSFRVWRTQLFFEAAIGTLFATDNIPPDGENLVFFQRYAFGLTLPIANQWHGLLGVSHMRFRSEASCCSGTTGVNTNGGFIAISYKY